MRESHNDVLGLILAGGEILLFLAVGVLLAAAVMVALGPESLPAWLAVFFLLGLPAFLVGATGAASLLDSLQGYRHGDREGRTYERIWKEEPDEDDNP